MFRKILFILLLLPSVCLAQSYKKLHKKSIVVDTHNDVLSTVIMRGLNIDNDLTGRSHSDIARFRKGGVDVQIFSVFCNERFGKDTAYKYANIEIDSLYASIGRNTNRMMLVRNPAELQRAVKEQKLACMIGVEGGHMIEDKIEFLDALFNRGARYLTLTRNNSTSWATSAADETDKKNPPVQKGLTDFGKQIVRRMNELGMIVDISHVGEQTFWDAINTTTKPVIASHSCAYSLCPVPRNLKDDQIKAIAKNGGVIHLNFFSGFVDSTFEKKEDVFQSIHKKEVDSLRALKWPNYQIREWIATTYASDFEGIRPPMEMLLDHLDYIVKLTSVDHVGLGSDFDGINSSPRQLNDVTSFPLITKELIKRGYSKKDIRKILGGNFIRVFEEVSGGAASY